jgi:hypothetical protein
MPSRPSAARVGPARHGAARGLFKSGLSVFFLGKPFKLFSDLQTCKFNTKISINSNDLIQTSVEYLLKYLSNGTCSIPFGPL